MNEVSISASTAVEHHAGSMDSMNTSEVGRMHICSMLHGWEYWWLDGKEQHDCESFERELHYLSILKPGDAYFEDYKKAILEEYARERIAWMDSVCRKDLYAKMHRRRILPSTTGTTKAVLMGLGTLYLENGSYRARHRRLAQLAVFLDLVEYGCQQGCFGPNVELYAQDPDFRPLDEAVLAELGIKILHKPKAESLCSADTFYFMPFCAIRQDIFISRQFDHAPNLMMSISKKSMYESRAWKRNQNLRALSSAMSGYSVLSMRRNPRARTDHDGYRWPLEDLQLWYKRAQSKSRVVSTMVLRASTRLNTRKSKKAKQDRENSKW